MRRTLRQFQQTWVFILSEREVLELLAFLATWLILFTAALAQAADPQTGPPLFTVFGIAVERQISLGVLGSGVVVCWQISRWGRRMVSRFADIPERIERLEKRHAELSRYMGTLRCVREDALRHLANPCFEDKGTGAD